MRYRSTILSAVLIASCAFALATATGAGAATRPSVTTGGAHSVSYGSATLTGTVNPNGADTSYYFQYWATPRSAPAQSIIADAGAGTKPVKVNTSITGLQPLTLYHYRLVAFSTAGTTRGGDRQFRTLQIPTVLSISPSPNPVVYGSVVSVTGVLTGPNVAGKTLALQGRAFPFTGPFQQIGNSVLTTAQGAYSFLLTPTLTMHLRVLDQSKQSVRSATVIESVALNATLHVRRSHRHPGRFRFLGRVTPARVGNAVLIQRRRHKRWKTVRVALTRRATQVYSRFSRRLRLHRGGRFRAVVRTAGGDYVDGTSRTVRVRVRRR
jgi:hypothetical protein